jgi:hypothetical protein
MIRCGLSTKKAKSFFIDCKVAWDERKEEEMEDIQGRRFLLVIQHGRAYEVPVGEDYVLPALGPDDADDEEERMRLEYEMEELRQDSERESEEEQELSPSTKPLKRGEEIEKENKEIIRSNKRPKEETGREKWERVTLEKQEKEVKKVVRMAKKMRREGKMKRIDSYFNK